MVSGGLLTLRPNDGSSVVNTSHLRADACAVRPEDLGGVCGTGVRRLLLWRHTEMG